MPEEAHMTNMTTDQAALEPSTPGCILVQQGKLVDSRGLQSKCVDWANACNCILTHLRPSLSGPQLGGAKKYRHSRSYRPAKG